MRGIVRLVGVVGEGAHHVDGAQKRTATLTTTPPFNLGRTEAVGSSDDALIVVHRSVLMSLPMKAPTPAPMSAPSKAPLSALPARVGWSQ
jgi:hypothetical protein